MASLFRKKGSPYWWASYRDAQKKQHTKSTSIQHTPEDVTLTQINEEAAQRTADEFERKARLGIPLDAPAPPTGTSVPGIPIFTDFTAAWIAGVGGDADYKLKLRSYMDNIDQFLQAKTSWQIHRLRHSDFIGLAPYLLQMGYSPTTVTLHLKALRAAFINAESRGFILVTPITPQDYLVNANPNGPKALKAPQLEHLLNATQIIDWRTTILFGFYCGMDLVPATSQVWPQLDLEARRITWVSSHANGQNCELTLPLHPVLHEHLLALRKVATTDQVTPKLHGLSDSALRAQFRRVTEASRLASATLETTFRKSRSDLQFGSLKLAFAQHLGHKGLSRLARFIRQLNADDLRNRIEQLPNLTLPPLPLLNAA